MSRQAPDYRPPAPASYDDLPLWAPRPDLHTTAAQGQREGMSRTEAAAALRDADWEHRAYLAVIACATKRRDFISDNVWEAMQPEDRPPLWPNARALGPVMRKAAKDGFIRKTDRGRPSVRSHLSPKPIWASLCFGKEEGHAA